MAKRAGSVGVKNVWRVLKNLMVPGSKVQSSEVHKTGFIGLIGSIGLIGYHGSRSPLVNSSGMTK
jgi:hypothetical protein